jgi:hypothetical protein
MRETSGWLARHCLPLIRAERFVTSFGLLGNAVQFTEARQNRKDGGRVLKSKSLNKIGTMILPSLWAIACVRECELN